MKIMICVKKAVPWAMQCFSLYISWPETVFHSWNLNNEYNFHGGNVKIRTKEMTLWTFICMRINSRFQITRACCVFFSIGVWWMGAFLNIKCASIYFINTNALHIPMVVAKIYIFLIGVDRDRGLNRTDGWVILHLRHIFIGEKRD